MLRGLCSICNQPCTQVISVESVQLDGEFTNSSIKHWIHDHSNEDTRSHVPSPYGPSIF